MTTSEQARFEKRLDQQDEWLRQILQKMAEHRKEHAVVDPSIQELVGILKGMKFLRATALLLGSAAAGAWAVIAWAKDHVKL